MKNVKNHQGLSNLITKMPTNRLRVFLYQKIFGYRISNSYISRGTIIIANDVEITNCQIGPNNRFVGPMNIVIKKGAKIGGGNNFICGWWVMKKEFESANYDRYLEIGEDTLITGSHHFDIAGSFFFGKKIVDRRKRLTILDTWGRS